MKRIFKEIIISIIEYEAKLVLKKYRPRVIVIVGSVGKTTTKDAVYSVLSKKYFVRKSEKSFNSEIGIPLTILGLQNAWSNPFFWIKNIVEGLFVILLKNKYPEWLVLEVGADHPGDIKKVATWLQSDIAILTLLPDMPVHVEFFSSPEAVAEEKVQIISSLRKGGTLIVNGDDGKILAAVAKHGDKKILTYGMEKTNDVVGMRYGIISKQKVPHGIRFTARHKEEDTSFEIGSALGKQHLYPALASIATGIVEGIPFEDIKKGLEEYIPPNGRMKILEGVKNTTIIDDSYNSSPVAAEEALRLLENVNVEGRKIVVFGDMMELGKFSIDEHKRIGGLVKGVADILVTVGFRARHFAEGALNMSMHGSKILQYDDVNRASDELEAMLQDGDIVLVKASQSIRLEKLVGGIMKEPLRKKELLVRQDIEWLKR